MPLRDVRGQDRAVRMLSGMLARGRIASTYLFGGPAGIGKRFTAMQFVKALNCEAPRETSYGAASGGDACGACISCRKVDSLIHPDLRVVAPEEGMIRIEDVRELEGFLSFAPLEGRLKAVVVEDAEKMNLNAANAFLKTLEEPPARSVIILLAVREDGLPDTVRSRAMRIGFAPLSGAAVRAIAEGLGVKIPAGRPALSIGGLGSAVGGEVLAGRDRALALLEAMVKGGGGGSPARGAAWKDREEMKEWFEAVSALLRDMAVIKVGGETPGVDGGETERADSFMPIINHDRMDDLARMCKTIDLKVIMECYEKLVGISSRFVYNPSEKITANYVGELVRSLLGRV